MKGAGRRHGERLRALTLALLVLAGTAQASDPTQSWLRGVLEAVSRGQLDRALSAFDPRLRTAEWRARLAALRGLTVTQLIAEPGGEGRYTLNYRVPQGSLNLIGSASLTVRTDQGTPLLVAWTARSAPRLDAAPGVLAPGTALALQGHGFPPKGVVELRLSLPGLPPLSLGRVQASLTGRFSLSVTLPPELAQAPPDAVSAQLSADGPGGPLAGLSLPFRPPSAPGELSARYAGAGFSLRYPGHYRSAQTPGSLNLFAPSGQLALRVILLAQQGGDPAAPNDLARVLAAFPDLLPAPTAPPAPLDTPLPGWSLTLPEGRTAALLADPQGGRWALLLAEPGYRSLLVPLARTLSFVPPPEAQPLTGP